MSRIIAGIYEIEKEIGAGGAGVVFLGRHIRLDKRIVLKADKRKLKTGSAKLRQEVDLLKELSHTYIPQVYDFIQEGDVVYTVMDYVDGGSLDKLLERGRGIKQKVVVRWACQLLEALHYLHSQKEHGILHGDIKPANIMLRKNGDICLIDFNIALALGEDGAVQVGYSRGYASPEHYGSKGALRNRLLETGTGSMGSSSSEQLKKKVLLDVRSDIYSLGATLYHLLSGKRPAQEASQVVPLSGCCSPQVAAIIQKAMNPDKELRYQTAEEMLDAFLHLRTNDWRVVTNKKRFFVSAAVCAVLFLLGGACSFTGMRQKQNYETALKLASYSQASLADGNKEQAVRQAIQAVHTGTGICKAPVPAEAKKSLADALGVYDLNDGFKADVVIPLPAEPFDIRMSRDGSRYAVVYAYEMAVYDVDGKEPLVTRKVQESALSDCLFLDENTVVYAGADGVEAFDLVKNKVLWTGEDATDLAVSGDGKVVAATDRGMDRAVLYNAADGKQIAEYSFQGRNIHKAANDIYVDRADYIFALDEAGERLAVSFADGGLRVFDVKDPDGEMILYDTSDYGTFSGGFCGKWFAYAAQGAGENFFGILDVNAAQMVGTMESRDKVLVRTDTDGICVANGNLLSRFDAKTLEETELAYLEGNTVLDFDVGSRFSMVETDDGAITFYDRAANPGSRTEYRQVSDFVRLADGYALFANREEPQIHRMRLEDHKDTQLFSYDAKDGHTEARISADEQTLMLFDYKGFRTYNKKGEQIAQCSLPDAGQIYDQQYRRKGKDSYLEVTWYDGTVRRYAVDGNVIETMQQEPPDKKLEEEFTTDRYRIVSNLHEPPKVYEKKNGKYIKELEKDAGLTYVTQLDNGYLMTEYATTDIDRYGILLDEQLNEVARLPYLCDVYGDTVVFDYQNGSIRSCKIYSMEELVAQGKAY